MSFRSAENSSDGSQDEFALATVNDVIDSLDQYPLQFQRRSELIWQIMFYPCEPLDRELPTGSPWYVCTLWFSRRWVEVFDGDVLDNKRISYDERQLLDVSSIVVAVRHSVEKKMGQLTRGVGLPLEEQL
jgi:hypothetical protein